MRHGGEPNSDRFGSLLLPRYRATVTPEWADRNGHLNNANYLVAVQGPYLTALWKWRGESDEDRNRFGNFTMQSLVTHLRELRLGANLLIIPRLIGVDDKRVHVVIELYNEDEGFLGAVIEKTAINAIRGNPPKVMPFAADVRARLSAVLETHADVPMPAGVRPLLPLNPRQTQQLAPP